MDTSNFYLFINNTNKQKMSTKKTLKQEWEKKKKKEKKKATYRTKPMCKSPLPSFSPFRGENFFEGLGRKHPNPTTSFPLPFPTKHPPKTSSLLLFFFSFFSLKGF